MESEPQSAHNSKQAPVRCLQTRSPTLSAQNRDSSRRSSPFPPRGGGSVFPQWGLKQVNVTPPLERPAPSPRITCLGPATSGRAEGGTAACRSTAEGQATRVPL